MKCYLLLLFIWIIENTSGSAVNTIEKKPIRNGHLKILMEDLQDLNWAPDEAPCLKQLLNIINNVQNSTLWATWIWDSMQTPVGQLYGSRNNYGNYDECLEFPWEKVHPDLKTQYCMAHIRLAEVDSKIKDVDFFGHVKNYFQIRTKHYLEFNTLRWGVCTPAVCKPHSVNKFVGALFKQTHLGLAVDKPHISIAKCDIAGEVEVTHDFGYYISGLLIASAIILTFLGTFLANYKGMNTKFSGLMYAQAFQLTKNIESVMRNTNDDLRSLFGLRVITFFKVIVIHTWLLDKTLGVSNALRLDKDFEDRWLLVIFTYEVIVDTFMFMSGLLLAKTLLGNGLKPFNPLKVLAMRYLRLIWPIIVVLLIAYKFMPLPRGPVKEELFNKELEACNQNWWTILLMVQNYVNRENMCYPVLWSVACDFHLTIMGTLGIWLFTKNRKVGLLVFFIGFIASIIIPAIGTVLNPELGLIPTDFRPLFEFRKYLVGNPMYTSTHFRAGSYFVGLAVGYLTAMYKPAKHRNIISKRYSILGFGAFLVMLIGYSTLAYALLTADINVYLLASYVSLKRIIWTMLITFLIFLCEYGTLPLVSGILGWSAWVPFSRISYGIYLVHISVISYWIITTRSVLVYDLYGFTLTTLGVTSISCVVSLLLWTFFEEPMRIIISLSLKERNKKYTEEIKKK